LSSSSIAGVGRGKRAYQRWQAELFRSRWFARTFVLTMGWLAAPIYEWAFRLMRNDIEGAARIADIGCGNGLMAYRCSREIAGRTWVLLDRSEAQLRAGGGLLRKMRPDSVVGAHVGRAESLPFRDASVEVVVSTGSINLWDDPVQGLRECRRLLRPGGVVWVFDQRPCDSLALAVDALFRKRVFGLGIPGHTCESVMEFGERAGLGAPRVFSDASLYGLRWATALR